MDVTGKLKRQIKYEKFCRCGIFLKTEGDMNSKYDTDNPKIFVHVRYICNTKRN